MKIKIYGKDKNTKELLIKVNNSLEELGLTDFIKVETTTDKGLKTELNIKKEPALIVEEDSIDFKDTIFEGIIPDEDELKSMFISIIGGGESSGCGTGEGGGCPTGCSC